MYNTKASPLEGDKSGLTSAGKTPSPHSPTRASEEGDDTEQRKDVFSRKYTSLEDDVGKIHSLEGLSFLNLPGADWPLVHEILGDVLVSVLLVSSWE